MSVPTQSDERRSSQRHRVLKSGKIVSPSLTSSIDVTVRDLSETGARLKLQAAMVLPPLFDLVLVSDGLLYPARLAWQRGELVGAQFVGQPKPVHLRRYL